MVVVGHPVLRVVEVETLTLGDHPPPSFGVSLEQFAQVLRCDLVVVARERLPGGALSKWWWRHGVFTDRS